MSVHTDGYEVTRRRALTTDAEFMVSLDARGPEEIGDADAEDLLDVLLDWHAGAVTRDPDGLVGTTITVWDRSLGGAADQGAEVFLRALRRIGAPSYAVVAVEVLSEAEVIRRYR